MLNKESFEIYGDSAKSDAILNLHGIDPSAEDKNKLAYAYGIMNAIANSDKKIGHTSETLPASARRSLSNEAEAIFKEEGVTPVVGSVNPVIW